MKGDFSRSSFDPQKHYRAVRMQQGRAQLDADWNEQADILLHLIATQLQDLVGPDGTTLTNPGFAITLVEPADQSQEDLPEEPKTSAKTLPDFQIGAGHYYVDGMLCENEKPVPFSRQPDCPDAESLVRKPVDIDHFLVYIDVWQRHITTAEDPAIREIALGGPDTSTRVKTVWQVKLLPLSGDPAGDQDRRDHGGLRSLADWKEFVAQASQKGVLKARWDQSKGAVLENHLYRAEIHTAADDHVTFKWSRENGSVVFPIENYQSREGEDLFIWEDVPGKDDGRLLSYLSKGLALDWAEGESAQIDKPKDGSTIRIEKDGEWARIVINEEEKTATLTTSDGKRRLLKVGQKEGKHELCRTTAIELNLEGLERDPHQLSEDDWVELVDDVTVLSGRSLPLCQVTELDRPKACVTLAPEQDKIDEILAEIGARELHHPLLRRWEDDAKLITHEPDTTANKGEKWLDLENGIKVAFSDADTYQVSDYWLIAARTRSTDGIEWPQKDGQPLAQAPHGVAHHYAPLGLLQFQEGHWSVLTEESTAFRSLPQITANLSETDGQLRKVQETTDKRFEEALSRLDTVRETVDTLAGQTHVFETVTSEQPLEKGDVVSLDRASLKRMGTDDLGTELPVKLASSKERHGQLVVGVVTEPMDDQRYQVALYGRVCCKVIGPVEPGDLLVPSPEPGSVQRRGWFFPMGPIIGKALSSTALGKGRKTGTLDILVTPNYRVAGSRKRVAIGISIAALILVFGVMGLFFRYSKTFRLDIDVVSGSVMKSPDKDSYSRGEVVSLMAVPDPNYTFDRWLGALSGRANPAVLVMDEDKSVSFVITNSIGMKLVYIPAGSFRMGSRDSAAKLARDYYTKEEVFADRFPQHQVRISKGFWMGQTEVTQGQYTSVMKKQPWSVKDDVREDVNNPAVWVSWNNASEFCRKLSQQEGKTYRLPTEAEWEYACRAGTTTRFSFGDSDSSLGNYAWFADNTVNVNEPYAHPVGQKKPNPWGLFDMHGNVYEWCSDWYVFDANYYSESPSVDPPGPSPPSGKYRCLRSGQYAHASGLLHSSFRWCLGPGNRAISVGFRVVRSQ